MEVVTRVGLGLVTAIALSVGAAWVVSDGDHNDFPTPDRRSTLFTPTPAPGVETVASNN